MSIFVILWYPTLQVSSGQFTVFDSILYTVYSTPPILTVYQTLAIFLLAIFFGKIWAFLGVNSTFCWLGDGFIQTRTVYYSVPHENQSLSVFHRHFPIENCPGLILSGETLIYYTSHRYLPLALSSMNGCEIDVMVLHHKKSQTISKKKKQIND